MILLSAFIAAELFLVLGIALYIDGRRPVPSVWIRNEALFAIIANVDVALLIFGAGGIIATLIEWFEKGVHVEHPWAIAASVLLTVLVVKTLLPRLRLVKAEALARAAAAVLPGGADPIVPRGGPLPG